MARFVTKYKTLNKNNQRHFLAPCPSLNETTVGDASWMGSDASFRNAEFMANMTTTELNDVTFSDSFDVDSLEKSEDAEDIVIKNLLKEHDIKQTSPEMTFLGDVEAPSGMFDQTIFNSTKLNKLTDVQRVGLLRPSTIIEEGSMLESESSRNNSKSIVLTKNFSETSTTVQSDVTSAETTFKTCIQESEVIEISEFTISSRDLETSSLSKTYKTAKTSQETQEIDESSEIVEISDSDSSLSPEVDYRRNLRNTLEDVSSLIEDSSGYDDEKSSSMKDEENESGIQEINDDSDPDQSISKMTFNDSLERMDYMMAKGARLLQQQSTLEANTPTNKLKSKDIMSNPITPGFMLSTPLIKPPRTPTTAWNSNNKTYDLIEKTPTLKMTNSPKTPSTVMKQRNINTPPLSSNSKPRFERIKPTPTNSFKKPLFAPGSSRIPQKTSSTKKPNQYDYIVSPIGTYIKNSPYVPLHKNIKSHKSLFESELCNRTRETDDFRESKENKKVFCDLPRKAYIASDLQHVRFL